MAIVSISRQVGSLGDEIARTLAAELNYKLIGREDFAELAEKYDPDFASKINKIEREEPLGFFERLFFSTPVYHSLYEAIVFELASRRQVIILGRGSQIVLREVHQAFRVRVVAPMHVRVIHLREVHGMSTDDALEYIRRHDQSRRALIRQVFDEDPKAWRLYDMVLNTAYMDTRAGVNILRQAIEEVIRLQPMEEAVRVLKGLALGKRVEARIRQEILPTQDVEVLGDTDGTVTLMGHLAAAEDIRRAEEVAAAYPGVVKVINKIQPSVLIFGY